MKGDNHVMITVTENAAEQINKVKGSMDGTAQTLRIAAVGGGCSGYQYQMAFDEKNDSDSVFESNGVSIIVDQQSLQALNGIEIDYVENLEGSSFVFKNPNATGGCGCGKSFSV